MCLVTGAITVTLVTPCYQVYDSNEEIYVEVQIRGEFYDNSWVYHPTDPTGESSGSTILMLNSDDASDPTAVNGTLAGVSGEIFQQGLRISVNSSSHRPGYYVPVIQNTKFTSGATMGNESTLYRSYGEWYLNVIAFHVTVIIVMSCHRYTSPHSQSPHQPHSPHLVHSHSVVNSL